MNPYNSLIFQHIIRNLTAKVKQYYKRWQPVMKQKKRRTALMWYPLHHPSFN